MARVFQLAKQLAGYKKHCHGRVCVFDDARTMSATAVG